VWQNAYSQLLYPEKYKEAEYLPPYDPNVVIISPELKKWVDDELAKVNEKRTIEMKTDVLGRTKPSASKTVQGTKEMELKLVAEPKQKRLVRISEMHYPQMEMEPIHGRYEYNPETKEYNYYLNDKKISLKEYENSMKKHHKKFESQDKSKRKLSIPGVISNDGQGWTALMTAEEIFTLISNHKELAIGDYSEDETTADIASILSTIQVSTHAFPNYKGNGIGVYVAEAICKDPSFPIADSSRYTNLCTGFSTDPHHNKVASIVQNVAPLAHVFGGLSSNNPSNPFSYSPPIEVSTHSYCKTLITGNTYSQYDMEMDQYIYNNRVITFVAAGNKGKCGTTYDVSSPGKALNAITVGAVHPGYPATNNYTDYSRWKNPDIGNEKPELAMFTDINMGIYGFLDGTSAATPLAAGFLATLLSQHPFCLRQPAMMKAALLAAERIQIQNNINPLDQDNSYPVAKGIINYSTAAWGTGGAWWDGDNSAFFNSNNEIVLTENNVQTNKRYRIAIAWLSDGNYIISSTRIQQNLDLLVYQNGKRIAISDSENNPFEVVDFIAPSNAPLTIIIRRSRNGDNGINGGRVILGYNINHNH